MPRKYALTWQPDCGGRRGRWRKKYRGQVHYFSFGSSKSDLDGYRLAIDAWNRKKDEIDAEEAKKPRPHQEQYERAIEEWKLVLQWARENADEAQAVAARQKLDNLTTRLARPKPPPLVWGDHVLDIGIPPKILRTFRNELAKLVALTRRMTSENDLPR
jgi:hypothetical protein